MTTGIETSRIRIITPLVLAVALLGTRVALGSDASPGAHETFADERSVERSVTVARWWLDSHLVDESQPETTEVARVVQQQKQEPQPEQPQVVPESPTGPRGLKGLLRGIGVDFWRLPSERTAVILGIGGGLSALVHPLDDDVNAHLIGQGTVHTFFAPGKVAGGWYVQMGTSLLTYSIGAASDKPRVAHLGLDLLRAQIVTQALTLGVKGIVRRQRPDSSGFSFPSGHASTTFATATVLERHLGWKFAVPTYVIASYVAASRLHENRHFLSDVVFGGALGIAVGQTVVRHGRNNFSLAPVVLPDGSAIVFTKVWGGADRRRGPTLLR